MKEYKRISLMVLSLLFLLALTILIAQRFLNVPSEVPTPPGPFPPITYETSWILTSCPRQLSQQLT